MGAYENKILKTTSSNVVYNKARRRMPYPIRQIFAAEDALCYKPPKRTCWKKYRKTQYKNF